MLIVVKARDGAEFKGEFKPSPKRHMLADKSEGYEYTSKRQIEPAYEVTQMLIQKEMCGSDGLCITYISMAVVYHEGFFKGMGMEHNLISKEIRSVHIDGYEAKIGYPVRTAPPVSTSIVKRSTPYM